MRRPENLFQVAKVSITVAISNYLVSLLEKFELFCVLADPVRCYCLRTSQLETRLPITHPLM